MPVPATTGQLRTRIEDMEIGDYIPFHYNGTTYSEGIGTKVECPVTGSPLTDRTNYFWYMIKVAKGILVADRIWNHSYTWDAMNASQYSQGRSFTTPNGVNIFMRSLTGGVAYADANGNMSLTDKGFGAFPTNNEWDRYITNFPTDKIQGGKTLDDVFHYNGIFTWTQDTPINGMVNPYVSSSIGSNTHRIARGFSKVEAPANTASNSSGSDRGFRPVFEYKEV